MARVRTMPGWSQRVVLGLGLFALVVFAFIGIIGPLFAIGSAQGEVDGKLPASIPLNQTASLPLAVDNVGESSISPLCIVVKTVPASVTLGSVDFQGVQTEPFNAQGVACGGELTTQETIVINVTLVAHLPGPLTLSLTAEQGHTAVGSPLTGTVQVVASGARD